MKQKSEFVPVIHHRDGILIGPYAAHVVYDVPADEAERLIRTKGFEPAPKTTEQSS